MITFISEHGLQAARPLPSRLRGADGITSRRILQAGLLGYRAQAEWTDEAGGQRFRAYAGRCRLVHAQD